MKKYTLIFSAALLMISLQSSAQKIVENKVADGSQFVSKKTSWEQLFSSLGYANVHFRISQTGDSDYLDIRVMLDKVFFITKGQELTFTLDNAEKVVLTKSGDFQATCNGCGAVGIAGSEAEGMEISYPIEKEQVTQLKAHKVIEVSFDLDKINVAGTVKDKNAQKMINSLNLLQ